MTIKEARKEAGLSQQAIASILKIPKRTLENWEGEKRKPPQYLEKLIIAEIRKISVAMKMAEKLPGLSGNEQELRKKIFKILDLDLEISFKNDFVEIIIKLDIFEKYQEAIIISAKTKTSGDIMEIL